MVEWVPMLPSNVVLSSSRECLPVADEGTELLRNVGNKFPTTRYYFPCDRNAQQHSCENLKILQERRGGGAKRHMRAGAIMSSQRISLTGTVILPVAALCGSLASKEQIQCSRMWCRGKVFVPSREEVTE